MSIEVPVLVVSTNEGKDLKEWLDCVDSLASKAITPIPCIADNASSDITLGVIWQAIRARRVSQENVLYLHSNLGFAAAQNQLIRHLGARGRYKWFATLNIDARADVDWLQRLVEMATEVKDDRIGMWGGLILEPARGRVSSAGHALRHDGAFVDIDWKRDPAEQLFSKRADFEPFCPCFAASLWSFSLVEDAGLPDSGQFLYYDDVGLAFKARLLGWRAAFVPNAVAYHPSPNSKRTVDRQRQLQVRGKLLMVVRYLPDAVARSLLLNLTDDARALLAAIDSRDKQPFLNDARRVAVYEAWVNKWIP